MHIRHPFCPAPHARRYESKQMSMIQTAQADELTALRLEVREPTPHIAHRSRIRGIPQLKRMCVLQVRGLSEERKEREAKLLKYEYLASDIDKLKALHAKAEEEAREAKQKREEAETDVLRQLDASQQLLEKLLGEQRMQFANSSKDLKERLESETAMRKSATSDLQRLKEQSEVSEVRHEAEETRLRDEVKRLSEVLKPQPAAIKKPKPVRTGHIDLDESPDAPPIAEQLAAALRKDAMRVLDLFRSWDANGDGQGAQAGCDRSIALRDTPSASVLCPACWPSSRIPLSLNPACAPLPAQCRAPSSTVRWLSSGWRCPRRTSMSSSASGTRTAAAS